MFRWNHFHESSDVIGFSKNNFHHAGGFTVNRINNRKRRNLASFSLWLSMYVSAMLSWALTTSEEFFLFHMVEIHVAHIRVISMLENLMFVSVCCRHSCHHVYCSEEISSGPGLPAQDDSRYATQDPGADEKVTKNNDSTQLPNKCLNDLLAV